MIPNATTNSVNLNHGKNENNNYLIGTTEFRNDLLSLMTHEENQERKLFMTLKLLLKFLKITFNG